MGAQKNCLIETFLLSTYNKCFSWNRKNDFSYLNTLLSGGWGGAVYIKVIVSLPLEVTLEQYLHPFKVRKKAKFRIQYNQVPYLTQEFTWESHLNIRKHHIQESQEVNPFQIDGHKASRKRHGSMAKTNTNTYNKKDSQRSTALELLFPH